MHADHGQMISIHPPRMGWDRCTTWATKTAAISIHPPRMGWDSKNKWIFLSFVMQIP